MSKVLAANNLNLFFLIKAIGMLGLFFKFPDIFCIIFYIFYFTLFEFSRLLLKLAFKNWFEKKIV